MGLRGVVVVCVGVGAGAWVARGRWRGRGRKGADGVMACRRWGGIMLGGVPMIAEATVAQRTRGGACAEKEERS